MDLQHPPCAQVAVPLRTLEGLDCLLEILHAVQLGRQDGDTGGVLGEHLVEGVIISARALVRAATDAAGIRL